MISVVGNMLKQITVATLYMHASVEREPDHVHQLQIYVATAVAVASAVNVSAMGEKRSKENKWGRSQ